MFYVLRMCYVCVMYVLRMCYVCVMYVLGRGEPGQ